MSIPVIEIGQYILFIDNILPISAFLLALTALASLNLNVFNFVDAVFLVFSIFSFLHWFLHQKCG